MPVVLLKRGDGGYARYRREGGQVRRRDADSAGGEDLPVDRRRGGEEPVPKEEAEGVRGKGEDGEAKTREAKVFVVHSVERRRPENGEPEKDPGSETWSGCIDSAAAVGGVSRNSDFAARLRGRQR